MNKVTEDAKGEFQRAVERVKHSFAQTPDDKINWSPAKSARTPVEIVAHCGFSIKGMQEWFDGKPFGFKDMADLDRACREEEAPIKTREEALAIVDKNADGFVDWLASLSDDQLGKPVSVGSMTFPLAAAITFPADHLRTHAAQIDYIQTIYGDRDMHFG